MDMLDLQLSNAASTFFLLIKPKARQKKFLPLLAKIYRVSKAILEAHNALPIDTE